MTDGGRAVRRASRDPMLVVSVVLTTVLLRVGTFVRPDVMDWDESTFLLVGQRLARGELPYTTTFDSKPPFAFVFTAIPMAIAPSSLVVARVTLALVVGATAALVMRLGRATGGGLVLPLGGAVLLAVLAGAAPSGAAWMTEHSANLVLAVLLVLTVRSAQDASTTRTADVRRAVAIGAVAAVLALTRANYAIVAIGVGAAWLAGSPRAVSGRRLAGAAGGGLAVGAMLVAVYGAMGALPELRAGLIDLTLSQGGGALPTPDRLPPGGLALVGLQLVLAAATGWRLRGAAGVEAAAARRATTVLTVANVTAALSVALHDVVWGHHVLIVIVPVAAQVAVAGTALRSSAPASVDGPADATSERRAAVTGPVRASSLAAIAAIAVLAALTVRAVAPEEVLPRPNAAAFERERDVTAAVAAALAARPGTVLAFDQHHVLWRLGLPPVHPMMAHPFPLTNAAWWATTPWQEGTRRPRSTLEATNAMLQLRPTHVITSADKPWDWLDNKETALMRGALGTRHRVVWTSSDGKVELWTCDTC